MYERTKKDYLLIN